MAFLFICGCAAKNVIDEKCKTKISTALASELSNVNENDIPIEIVVSLHDSTGIQRLFPSLSIPNAKVALGHLTKKEIFSLCSQYGVSMIDKPRTSYPKK